MLFLKAAAITTIYTPLWHFRIAAAGSRPHHIINSQVHLSFWKCKWQNRAHDLGSFLLRYTNGLLLSQVFCTLSLNALTMGTHVFGMRLSSRE